MEWWKNGSVISYSAHYTIIGEIISLDNSCFDTDGIKIVLHPSMQSDFYIPNEQTTYKYFIISLYNINTVLPPDMD